MFLKDYPLEAKNTDTKEPIVLSVQAFCVRLASFCHLGLISDPLMGSKFHSGIHNAKGQENKIYNSEDHGEVLPPPNKSKTNTIPLNDLLLYF